MSASLDPRHNSSIDWNLALRAGKIPGLSKDTALGHSDAVPNAALRCLYHGADTADIFGNVASLIQSPVECFLASTDAQDASGGSGATSVLISGLDANLDPKTATVTPTGQTPVSIGTWGAIRKLQVVAAGVGGKNAGTLWVAKSSSFASGIPNASNHLNAMELGTNISATALMVVPRNHKWFVDQFTIYSGDTTKTLNFQFYQYSYATGLWYEAFDIHGTQGNIEAPVLSYPALTGGDAVMLRCVVSATSAKVTGSISGILAKND